MDKHCGNCAREGDQKCMNLLIRYYTTSIDLAKVTCKFWHEKGAKVIYNKGVPNGNGRSRIPASTLTKNRLARQA